MMILPDDVIHITIDHIIPPNINNALIEIYEEYCANYKDLSDLKPRHYLYTLLAHYSNKIAISNKIIYDALIALLQLRTSNTILKRIIDSKCRYDIPTLLKSYINIFRDRHKYKMINVLCDVSNKYVEATHCNSGCINCAAYLPSWWPSLSLATDNIEYTSHIPNSDIALWNLKTDTYIRDGCCSFECYRQTRMGEYSDPHSSLLQLGQRRELYCITRYCNAHISPVQAAIFHIKFCSLDCQYNYNETHIPRRKRMRYD